MKQEYYKKSGLTIARIARELLLLSQGDRIPSIQEYVERLAASRGTVQSALLTLEKEGALRLEKRGKMGSYIAAMDQAALFRLGELNYITGSMPAPVSLPLAGLATGICRAMSACPVPYTFAFVQGSTHRAEALCRRIYDFAVVSAASARRLIDREPRLETVVVLEKSQYSTPYALYMNQPHATEMAGGFSIAADPASTDQWELTGRLCAGKDARIITSPYVSTRAAFLSREVDCLIYRKGDVPEGDGIFCVPLSPAPDVALQRPAILIHRENHGIAAILRSYLADGPISEAQQAVVDMRMEPRFY